MTHARIFSPSKTSMQSGKAKTGYWVLQFNTCEAKYKDPVMGWTGSTSTLHQIQIKFKTLEEAISYAAAQGINAIIEAPHTVRPSYKSYAENFRFDRPTF